MPNDSNECNHPFVWPDGNCVQCGVLATTMPGHTEPHHICVPRKFGPLVSALRSAAIEEAAWYMEENYHCSDCNGSVGEFVDEMRRSLKGKNHA